MGVKKYPLTPEEFKAIYAKVPRLNVEIILLSDKGVLLTKRAIEPCAGQWHIPGGTVRYREYIENAVVRIADKELSIAVNSFEIEGVIEYPNLIADGYGDPRGLVCVVRDFSGDIVIDEEASEYRWFKIAPESLLKDQTEFLLKQGFLEAKKIVK